MEQPSEPPASAPAAEPPAASAEAGDVDTDPAIVGTDPTIVVSAPPPIDVDAVGLPQETGNALPADLWKGSTRGVVDRLLSLLPAPIHSPTARGLAVRVLTASGPSPSASEGAAPGGFVAARAERLLALGNVTAATALARAVPRAEENERLSHVLLDGLLAANDNAGTCQLVRRQIGRFDTPYWQKALIFCQALAGEQARAQLGLSMLRDSGADNDDPIFARLVDTLLGDQRPIGELTRPTPLHLAMMNAAQQQIPASAVSNADPLALRMIAQSPNVAPEVRLEAAERAEAVGALSTEALVQVLEAASFKPEELANALSLAEKAPQSRAHAAIYRAAKAQAVGIGRAEALHRGWQIGRARGFYPAAVRTTLALLTELSPTRELAWFAYDAGRALLLAGRVEEARRWYELAREEAAVGARTEQSEILLWPLLRLAGADVMPPDPKALAAWRATQEKLDAGKAAERTALLVALLEGLGDATDGSLAALLLSGDLRPQSIVMPHPALWLGRDGAASAGRLGETVLFVLATLGTDGPDGLTPHTLVALLQALRAVGLEGEARALAIEAAITAGL
ncbi:MAG TPA: hypothetical protein VF342_14870 [Alphaproteobacteria bacterium]